MGYLKKIMGRLNKPFEPITTLVIIYLGLVTVSVAIYALIQMYVEEKELAASLLSWTATIFATIALLYTFNSWRDQKGSEIVSNKCEILAIDFRGYVEGIRQDILYFVVDVATKKQNIFEDRVKIEEIKNISKQLDIIYLFNRDKDFLKIKDIMFELKNDYEEVIGLIKKQNEDSFFYLDFNIMDSDLEAVVSAVESCYQKLDLVEEYVNKILSNYIYFKR